MISAPWRRILAPLLLSLVLLVSACAKPDSSPYAQVQEDTSKKGAPAAVSKGAVAGSQFNKFFPNSGSGYEVVPAQEKQGFAEYKVNRGGKNVAVLSINDTAGNPTATAKFQSATAKVAGYPAVDQGQNITAILVNNRYQVKVQSRDASFTKDDRTAWLQKFDLRGLSKLPTNTSATPRRAFPPAAKAPALPSAQPAT